MAGMPRVSRNPKARPPTMQQPAPTPDGVMLQARNTIAELVALGRSAEDIVFMVGQDPKLSVVPVASINRMRAAAQQAFEQGVAEAMPIKRAKQERRVMGLIARARQKGALTAEIQAEKLLAELTGTLAPREVIVRADAATMDALAAVLSILPADVLGKLARGEAVSLGHVGPNGQPVLTIESANAER